ncbi:MAG TPA: lysophospholipid acyltransferase family protein [Devosia sp.]
MGRFIYHFTHSILAGIPRLAARLYQDGYENVPREGPALLLANHISHFDPQLLAWGMSREVHYMADKPLLEIPVLGPLMRMSGSFAIDRTKPVDRAALRTAMEKLKAGHIVGIFPEAGIRHGEHAVLGGSAELPVGTAGLWQMMNVPVLPMVILGSDQLYALKNYVRRPRVFIRAGKLLPPDKDAPREEMRDRIVAAWRELYDGILRDYNLRPDEFPQSAHKRWGVPEPEFKQRKATPSR